MLRKRLYWIFMVLAACCVLQAAFDSVHFIGNLLRLRQEALEKGRKEVDQAATNIARLIHSLRQAGADLAEEINTGEVPQRDISKRLQEALGLEPKLFGIGVAFHPLSGDPDIRRHAPLYATRERLSTIDTSDLLEVAQFPIFHTDSLGNRITVGKVWVDITRSLVQDELATVGLGRHGFSFLLSREGRYLVHPRHELVEAGRTLFELAVEENTPDLVKLGKAVIQGKPEFIELQSGESGQTLLTFTAPVAVTGWSVGSAYINEPLMHPNQKMKRSMYRVILALCFFFIFLILSRLSRNSGDLEIEGWNASICTSLVFTFGIAAIWLFTLYMGEYHDVKEAQVHESSVLARMQNEYSSQCRLAGKPEPLFVPTGVYIESIEFQSAINVKLTGFIWQRWPASAPEGIETGAFFPESQEGSLEQVYEAIEGDQRVVGWTFQTVVRQTFNYATYPFDMQAVWLRMWPKKMSGPVVLVPDFQAFQSMNPKFTPGISKTLILPGWIINSSYFSFSPFEANTDFGLSSRRGSGAPPELRYNVVIQREFLDAFISCILPIFVVIILMFAVLFIHTKNEGIAGRVGFNSSVTVQVAAALFFVVLFAQIDLRGRLEIEKIMYMDFYYFLTYLVFLIVSIDSIAYGWTNRVEWLQWRENIIPKLFYWPTVMFSLFVVTAWFFYP